MAAVDPHQESKVASALMSSWDWKWCKPLFAYFPSTSGQNLKPKVKLSTSQSFANSNYMNLEIWILEVPLNYTDYCTTRKYESNTFIAWWHISHQSREITKMIIVFSFLEKKEKKKSRLHEFVFRTLQLLKAAQMSSDIHQGKSSWLYHDYTWVFPRSVWATGPLLQVFVWQPVKFGKQNHQFLLRTDQKRYPNIL